MPSEIFVKQLDGCAYVSGGLNCTCACEAMWLHRATQGRITTTACQCRRDTGDKSGGTNLSQMEQVSIQHGVTSGRVYRPATASLLTNLIATGRYGAHLQGSYSILAKTRYDCFFGQFRGNHDWFISGPGSRAGTWRVGDPGADGRKHGLVAVPHGFQDIPIVTMLRAAALLDVGGHVLGTGKVYTYLTPPDPTAPSGHSKAIVSTPTALWNDSTKRWVYSTTRIPAGTKLEIRARQFPKGGQNTYPVTCGTYACNHPGYYVPVKNVRVLGGV